MNGMIESHLVQHINAQCHPQLLYLHKLSGIRYAATYESTCSYELSPIHGESQHASIQELANSEVWQLLP
ncbi:hypothetical protein HNE05_12135 [Aquipseudomonas campi]|uniref:Uncharacterized protein n=1 Tax=Aquipseudomonas campi TaxID=2731681 RepID=A0A6M8FD19_9GAMM|nr:hypothetical protein [Pseudomonas campi]QKE64063.1 hypothetical protein HNE05_12135 [Pseudomonas campi]